IAGLLKNFGCNDPEMLGKGSSGVVTCFRHPQRKDEVAIKCVSLEDLREGEEHLRIGLRHENIVPLQLPEYK
ncbi:hypothetical protein AVEN_254267-1, partial [Araneus ventricosus]